MKLYIVAAWGLLFFAALADAEPGVLQTQPGDPPPSGMMSRYLGQLATAALDRAQERFEDLKTAEQISAYQAEMKDLFVRALGGWPERTPLNARVVGTIEREDYRVEKIIFESRPGFPVTGLLFMPPGPGPHPASLICCGHSTTGKELEEYQAAAILLATNGIAAFLYDPISQGERVQLFKENGQPMFSSTTEHTVIGVGSMLVGLNTASYRVWDGMRAIDYLCSRDDIDPKRIGCTGNSGGGTLTSYLMALDERIVCAAPACYLVGLRTLLSTIGPQDAEQNIHGQLASGMDHVDYLLMRAPKPTLFLCATDDFFGIDGTWSIYRQAKRFYGRLNLPERVSLVEAEAGHGFSKPLREGMVRWMRRWLMGIDDVVSEPEKVVVLTADEVRCTPEGQILKLKGARSVFDLNAERAEQLAEQRRRLWTESTRDECFAKVRQVAGIRPLSAIGEPVVRSAGQEKRSGYAIERLIIEPEDGIWLPAVAFVPDQHNGEACLYLDGEGKQQAVVAGGPIEALVAKGHLVLAVDLRGIGETRGVNENKALAAQFGSDWQDAFLAYMLGKTFVGMRAEDAMVAARFLASYRASASRNRVRVIATGECVVPALHAVALEPELFVSASLEGVPTWSELLRKPLAKGQLINAVHGVLGVYDLDDLRASIAPGKLIDKP